MGIPLEWEFTFPCTPLISAGGREAIDEPAIFDGERVLRHGVRHAAQNAAPQGRPTIVGGGTGQRQVTSAGRRQLAVARRRVDQVAPDVVVRR